jgi:hypothetical protein
VCYLQGGGGGLETSNNRTTGKIGVRILLVGLVLQLISYACFVVILVHTHHKIVKDARTNGLEPWWKLIWLLYFSSVCILVSHLHTHPWKFIDIPSLFRSVVSIALLNLRKVKEGIWLLTKVSPPLLTTYVMSR